MAGGDQERVIVILEEISDKLGTVIKGLASSCENQCTIAERITELNTLLSNGSTRGLGTAGDYLMGGTALDSLHNDLESIRQLLQQLIQQRNF